MYLRVALSKAHLRGCTAECGCYVVWLYSERRRRGLVACAKGSLPPGALRYCSKPTYCTLQRPFRSPQLCSLTPHHQLNNRAAAAAAVLYTTLNAQHKASLAKLR